MILNKRERDRDRKKRKGALKLSLHGVKTGRIVSSSDGIEKRVLRNFIQTEPIPFSLCLTKFFSQLLVKKLAF